MQAANAKAATKTRNLITPLPRRNVSRRRRDFDLFVALERARGYLHQKMSTESTLKTQIVVVGGGAGGLELVKKLGARFSRKHFDIFLVEPHQTHVWKPLLHEVAAGSLDANLDEVGYRAHARRWGYRFFQGKLQGIDRAARRVILAPLLDEDGVEVIGRQALRYDYLVLAVGSVTNSYRTPGADRFCIFLDDREEADRFRMKLLNQCLRVSRQMSDDPANDAHVRVAIVGGGGIMAWKSLMKAGWRSR